MKLPRNVRENHCCSSFPSPGSQPAAAKQALIHDHLDQCLEQAMQVQRGSRGFAVDEFKEITKSL